MSKLTLHRPHNLNPLGLAARLPQKLRNSLRRIAETRASLRRIRAYWFMSDEQLRARSLKREDIVRLVLAGVI